MEYAELADLLMRRSYLVREPHEDPFVLSSGKTSSHYFDVERTTSYAPALPLIGRAIFCGCGSTWPPITRCIIANTSGQCPAR